MGVLVFVASFGVALLLAAALLLGWATLPASAGERRVRTELTGRETPRETAERLVELGLLESPRLFAVYLGWFAPGITVAGGPHLLREGLSPRRLVQRLARLPTRPSLRVTLPEGYNQLQIAERLEQNEICTAGDLRRAASDSELLAQLGIHGSSAEGYLFPSTYELFVNSDPKNAVRLLVAETRKRLARVDARTGGALAQLAERRSFGEREVLTLASIVEREAGSPEERPLVASVFYNRLDDPSFRPLRMLQSDPTAAYGCAIAAAPAPSCAAFTGRVTPEMLRDAANPFNTYRHAGLPPGPIANPGEGAIEAVLRPAQSPYLYFVADGRGRHRFSRTFEEHRRAIPR